MSILVDRNTRVITQGMTGGTPIALPLFDTPAA